MKFSFSFLFPIIFVLFNNGGECSPVFSINQDPVVVEDPLLGYWFPDLIETDPISFGGIQFDQGNDLYKIFVKLGESLFHGVSKLDETMTMIPTPDGSNPYHIVYSIKMANFTPQGLYESDINILNSLSITGNGGYHVEVYDLELSLEFDADQGLLKINAANTYLNLKFGDMKVHSFEGARINGLVPDWEAVIYDLKMILEIFMPTINDRFLHDRINPLLNGAFLISGCKLDVFAGGDVTCLADALADFFNSRP